jgi:hypothetical protein
VEQEMRQPYLSFFEEKSRVSAPIQERRIEL